MLTLRQHQLECLDVIDKHFAAENNRGLVKMFCGAGKSLIIYNALIKHGADLAVVVVPSINLITQFNTDYLIKFADVSGHDYTTLTICSKDEIATKGVEFTTEPDDILEFLESGEDDVVHKIILVTYQSLETLFNVIEEYEYTIDLICFDEAHHIVADGVQELLFGESTDEYSDERYGFIDSNIERSLFFTATPINKNGICMFTSDNHITVGETDYEIVDTLDSNECSAEEPHCGDMIYEYMHIDGVNDNVLNDFDIMVMLMLSVINIDPMYSLFETIARAILMTGNSRVLTFHSRSETANDKVSDVVSFYSDSNKKLFKTVFNNIVDTEFPDKKGFYKSITLTGITGNTKNRTKILGVFDNSPDTAVYLLGSCETIGEGVDTKNANMCVFVDPKQSYVKIIQNIGRICRKQIIRRNGTVLIPAYVDAEKYKDCDDAVSRDKVIREDMSKTGDFKGILNCLSALRQEDPYMFELCLKYPDIFTKKELRDNFRKNGLNMNEKEYSGPELFSDLGTEYKGGVSERANFNMLSRKLGTNIQVSRQKILEEDLFIDRGSDKTTHFVKTNSDTYMKVSTDMKDTADKKGSTSGCRKINKPHRNIKPFVHANPDVQVLWKFTSVLEVGNAVFGGYIDADVIVDNEEKWLDKLEEVKKYIDTNNKRPIRTDKDQNVKKMGSWLHHQLHNYNGIKQIMVEPKIRKAWETFVTDPKYSQYFTSNTEEWYINLENIKTYINTNNKRPSCENNDQNIKKMGIWIGTQLKNYKKSKYIMAKPKFRKAWESFIEDPKYSKYFTSNEKDWYEKLEIVKIYIDINNKRPSHGNKDKTIKNLGSWLGHQLKNYKKSKYIMAKPKFRKAWESFIEDPKYSKYFTSKEDDWYNTLDAVKNYIDTNNNRPRTEDNDNTIKNLGIWLSHQKQSYTKSTKIMKVLQIRKTWESFIEDPKYSKYFISNFDEWYNKLEAIKNYIDTHKKRPVNIDKDKYIEILGRWINTQLNAYKESKYIMKEPEIHQAWESFITDPKYSQYFISNIEEWYNNLEDVKNYIDIYDKRPNCKDGVLTIKKFGTWIGTQLKNYKKSKYIMKEPEIRQAWEDFITDPKYAPYFTTESKPAPKSTKIKPKIKTIDEPKETELQKQQRKVSEYQELTKKMATQKSENTNKMFITQPSLWHEYHDCRDFSFKGYDKQDEIPINKIIKYLETKKNHKLKILDLGCGRNLIQEHFKDNKKFTITGYDYVSYNGSKVADISKLPEEDESINICVYSQSLMGSNWKEYLSEGYRVLVYNSEMIISESVERYEVVKAQLEAIGMHIIREEYAETNRWFYIYAIKQ